MWLLFGLGERVVLSWSWWSPSWLAFSIPACCHCASWLVLGSAFVEIAFDSVQVFLDIEAGRENPTGQIPRSLVDWQKETRVVNAETDQRDTWPRTTRFLPSQVNIANDDVGPRNHRYLINLEQINAALLLFALFGVYKQS